jgi:hypothetical protein
MTWTTQLDKLLAKDVGKQKLTQAEADEARARIKTVASIEDFGKSDVQLVVEVSQSRLRLPICLMDTASLFRRSRRIWLSSKRSLNCSASTSAQRPFWLPTRLASPFPSLLLLPRDPSVPSAFTSLTLSRFAPILSRMLLSHFLKRDAGMNR